MVSSEHITDLPERIAMSLLVLMGSRILAGQECLCAAGL
jgi:hypothetical protein